MRSIRSTGSTISSARKRCRTSWRCASPTVCSSRCGIAQQIDHVQITVAETVGVEHRGKFYEKTGALRDMVPNHVLQLLAMTAMEPPISFDADAVRAKKTEVLQAIKPIDQAQALRDAVRGQYDGGTVLGDEVRAYRQEPDVAPHSTPRPSSPGS